MPKKKLTDIQKRLLSDIEEMATAAQAERKEPKKARREKTPSVVSIRWLRNRYGPFAVGVLDCITPISRGPNAKRKLRKFRVTGVMPSRAEFEKLRDAKYTRPLGDVVSDAYSEIELVREELEQWYDNLPDNLKTSAVAEALDNAVNTLSNHSEPNVPEELQSIPVLYLPSSVITGSHSRASRIADAGGEIEACADALRASGIQSPGKKGLIDELDEAHGELSGIDIPGMYG